jgi:hypothetical protein
MKAVIISYLGGMFGEFFTDLLQSSDSKFYFCNENSVNDVNKYTVPNYLSPINLDIKNLPYRKEWPITDDDIKILNDIYGDKWICLHTHWLHRLHRTNLPSCIGIRLYCDFIPDINLSYCMWWIKTGLQPTNIWPEKKQEIEELINSNHKFKKEFEEMLASGIYHGWKFAAYCNNFLKNDKLDVQYFVRYKHAMISEWPVPPSSKLSGWIPLDIGQLIHRYNKYDKRIEKELSLENPLDVNKINSYGEKNLTVLKNTLGLEYEDLLSIKWINTLIDYCQSKLE